MDDREHGTLTKAIDWWLLTSVFIIQLLSPLCTLPVSGGRQKAWSIDQGYGLVVVDVSLHHSAVLTFVYVTCVRWKTESLEH